ncbi:MAG TPA: hypothetical protein VKR21_11965 [Solirubrobacteraceae bacterium]|nr:hypothetical protein [Solirubrobacteraceae bacterium]
MLRNAVGINFNVQPQNAAVTAQLLAQSGFKRVRLDIAWDQMSYANPAQLQDPAKWDTYLQAFKAAGLRPLILVDADDTDPGPFKNLSGQIQQPAAAGATTIQVDPTTAQSLVPGLSGLDLPGYPVAAFMATAISPTGQIQLSQPLPRSVPAGTYMFTLLRYGPFAPPFTTSGQPNPAFEQTLSGWLQYINAVTSEARKILGNDQFDIEVWNENSLDSSFLNVANYYNPVPPSLQGVGNVTLQLLARTAAWIRNPANNLPDVGLGDGFANTTPFASGATVPPGVTAIDKHPYHEQPYDFPQAQVFNNQQPVNALGVPEGSQDASGAWHDPFIPTYQAYFPEYTLTGLQTEFMERDLSPITTMINGVPHGRNTKPPGATVPPQVWVTETNIDLTHAAQMGLTSADAWHLQAKATLRSLAAFVNKGVSAFYFYAVTNGSWAMVDPTAPGGGPTMTAVKSFLAPFAGPNTITSPRSLNLLQIADQGNWTQFAGDGTAAHPALYNRDVVAFFPFQVDSSKFVIPAYVMTRSLATLYNPTAPSSDVTRYDLPPETYRITVGGLNTANLTVSATDPLSGASVPISATPISSSAAVLTIPLTDYPRLITIQDG